MNERSQYYKAGECNLNPLEAKRREQAGWFGLFIFIIVSLMLWFIGVGDLLVVAILFIPAWIAAIGFLQAFNNFCTTYGSNGQYSLNDNIGDIGKASSEEAKKDRARVKQLKAYSILIASTSTGLMYVLLNI